MKHYARLSAVVRIGAVLTLAGLLGGGCSAPAKPMAKYSITASGGPSASPMATATIRKIDDRIAGLPGHAAAQAVVEATRSGGPVHLTGTYSTTLAPLAGSKGAAGKDRRVTLTLDVHGIPSAVRATITQGKWRTELIRVDDAVYIRGYLGWGKNAAAPAQAKEWTKYSPSDPVVAPWLVFTDVPTLVAAVLTGPDEAVTISVGDRSVGDRPASTASGAATATGSVPSRQLDVTANDALLGAVTVSADGKPVPLALTVTDASGSGDFEFSEWGRPYPVTAPS